MSLPLHTLKHEHRVIERALRGVRGICAKLDSGEQVPLEIMSDIVDFVQGFADRFHHGKEESYLFPALQRQGIALEGGSLGAITHEHEVERALTTELDRALRGLKEGDELAIEIFVEAATRYTDHLTGHIRHEDAILFRFADEMLDEEEKETLGDNFKQAAGDLGEGEVERYEQIATRLEQDWA